jgi:hypothetical protein
MGLPTFFGSMTYEKQILQILTDVGEQGIGVQQLAKHVYNMNCTLFSQPDLQEIHGYVQQYLLRNSKSAQSLIERTGKRGYYKLNTQNNADARQMVLAFREKREAANEEVEEKPQCDLSLSLFD